MSYLGWETTEMGWLGKGLPGGRAAAGLGVPTWGREGGVAWVWACPSDAALREGLLCDPGKHEA